MNNIFFEGNLTRIKSAKNFLPEQVFDCGQCFRFDKNERGNYCGVARGKFIEIEKSGDDILLHNCKENDFNGIFRDFFDLDFDYSAIPSDFPNDEILKKASEFGSGIRILHQDNWEALCSFIISQNNNIPRIKGIIRNLCERYGEPVFTDDCGKIHYSFPSAEIIADAGESAMAELRTGFRAKYIYDAASKVASGKIDLNEPYALSYADGAKYLMEIKGVGLKVASCVLLFSYRKYDSFPVDVWVKRILQKYYDGKADAEYFGRYAGLCQQYLFYFERCENNVFLN
ncbi:MAG: DNA glycosylase [Clostridia bacterium]|nr:DNA glycosylase [Clostridia bacterium]